MGMHAEDMNGVNGGYEFDINNEYKYKRELTPKPFEYCTTCKETQVKVIKENKWVCEKCESVLGDYVA
jgi:ribosomal protein L37AE/L43A